MFRMASGRKHGTWKNGTGGGSKFGGAKKRGGFWGIGRALKKFLGLDYSSPVMMSVAPETPAPDVTESSENVQNAQLLKRKRLAAATKTQRTDASAGSGGSAGKQTTLG